MLNYICSLITKNYQIYFYKQKGDLLLKWETEKN